MLVGFPCLFHLLTGLYCPGCGGTRAVIYLFHGRILASFLYHPFVLYVAAVAGLILVARTAEMITHRQYLRVRHYSLLSYAGLGIVVINCIIKNYFLVVKGIDLLP